MCAKWKHAKVSRGKVLEIKVKDKPELILPKNIESPELAAQEINEFLNTDGRKIPHLYKYGQGNTTLAAALEHCRLYTDRQTKAFLTRHASEIAGIYSGEVEEFTKYIHAGVFTNIALKKMFAELEVNKKERDDLTVLKGYLLGAIKPQESNFCL